MLPTLICLRTCNCCLITGLSSSVFYLITDDAIPFKRIIQPEEAWLYKFPHTKNIIAANTLHVLNAVISLLVIWAIYKFNKNIRDAVCALLGVSLSIYLAAFITNLIKLVVGRPRPDFFARCFKNPPADDITLAQAHCDRPSDIVLQGYKSFPSGHSTMAFGCMAYLSLYISWGLRVFSHSHSHNSSIFLLAFLTPLVLATLVAASRTADYHHHWQDVTVGSVIGCAIAYLCYRQSFPSIVSRKKEYTVPLSPTPQPESLLTSVQVY